MLKQILIPFLLISVVAIAGCTDTTGQAISKIIPKPDFSIQDAGSKINDLIAGFNVNLKFNVVNVGNAGATDTRVNIEVIDSKTGRVAAQDTFVIDFLGEGQARLIEKTYNVWRGQYTVRIQVNSAEGVSESTQFTIG